jgi:Domain of unknown function (DUF1877)
MGMYGTIYRIPASEATRLASLDVEGLMEALDAFETVDLDKSWNAVSWLSSKCGALDDAVLSGEPIGEDLGYGPIIYRSPAQTKQIGDFLSTLSEEKIDAEIDFAKLTSDDIYPGVWDREEEEDDNRVWLLQSMQEMIALYAAAGAAGEGTATIIS